MGLFVLVLALTHALPLAGYLTSLAPYASLQGLSDAIVIAIPIERRELDIAAELPGVKRGNAPIAAVEIRTTFVVVAVLRGKGLAAHESIELRHYRERNRVKGLVTAGPMLIDFDPQKPRHYLMFLKLLGGDLYEAANPVEPGWCIEPLAHPVEPPARSGRER